MRVQYCVFCLVNSSSPGNSLQVLVWLWISLPNPLLPCATLRNTHCQYHEVPLILSTSTMLPVGSVTSMTLSPMSFHPAHVALLYTSPSEVQTYQAIATVQVQFAHLQCLRFCPWLDVPELALSLFSGDPELEMLVNSTLVLSAPPFPSPIRCGAPGFYSYSFASGSETSDGLGVKVMESFHFRFGSSTASKSCQGFRLFLHQPTLSSKILCLDSGFLSQVMGMDSGSAPEPARLTSGA